MAGDPSVAKPCADVAKRTQLALFDPTPQVGLSRSNRPQGGGRAKGTPNKVTQEFRETVQKLLDSNRHNVSKWLAQLAEGTPAVLDPVTGKVLVPAKPGDVNAALTRLGYLAEFAAPRLSRVEQVGEGGGPMTVVIRKEL